MRTRRTADCGLPTAVPSASRSVKRPSYKARPTMHPAIGSAASRSQVLQRADAARGDHGGPHGLGQRGDRVEVRALERPVARDVGVDDAGDRQVVELPGQRQAPSTLETSSQPSVATRPSRASSPRSSRSGIGLGHPAEPVGIAQRLGAHDDPLHARFQPGGDRRLVADPAAELAGHADAADDLPDRLDVDGPARLGAVQVDQVDPRRPFRLPARGHRRRDHRRRSSPGRNPPGEAGRSALLAGRSPGSLA